VVREAGKRVRACGPFDVQADRRMVLHEGQMPEMKTARQKTLWPPCRIPPPYEAHGVQRCDP